MIICSLAQGGNFKIIENHSLNSVHLRQKQFVGILELVILIPLKKISKVWGLQLDASRTEESILLYSVQPRVNTLVEEMPINWEQLGSSVGAEL